MDASALAEETSLPCPSQPCDEVGLVPRKSAASSVLQPPAKRKRTNSETPPRATVHKPSCPTSARKAGTPVRTLPGFGRTPFLTSEQHTDLRTRIKTAWDDAVTFSGAPCEVKSLSFDNDPCLEVVKKSSLQGEKDPVQGHGVIGMLASPSHCRSEAVVRLNGAKTDGSTLAQEVLAETARLSRPAEQKSALEKSAATHSASGDAAVVRSTSSGSAAGASSEGAVQSKAELLKILQQKQMQLLRLRLEQKSQEITRLKTSTAVSLKQQPFRNRKLVLSTGTSSTPQATLSSKSSSSGATSCTVATGSAAASPSGCTSATTDDVIVLDTVEDSAPVGKGGGLHPLLRSQVEYSEVSSGSSLKKRQEKVRKEVEEPKGINSFDAAPVWNASVPGRKPLPEEIWRRSVPRHIVRRKK